MALNESCQQTRESWFESFEDDFDSDGNAHAHPSEAGEWSAHVESCPDCADFVDSHYQTPYA